MFGIDDAINAGETLITTIANKFAPDATTVEHDKMTQALTEMSNQYAEVLGQLKINEAEAANPNWFVAGARPAAMWVGVLSLFYSGIGISLMSWLAAAFGLPPLPVIDTTTANNILIGLLGLGGMRTAEKLKGVETKGISKK
jgi:hypothetical protein